LKFFHLTCMNMSFNVLIYLVFIYHSIISGIEPLKPSNSI